jgi:hypothetical protein
VTVDLCRSIARLVPHPGQNTSSHSVPAISAAPIVGDHSMSRLAASCSFQRSMRAIASARAAASATCRLVPMAIEAPCPGRGSEAQPHGSRFHFNGSESGFHFTGVTGSGVPLLVLTQPAAVRLHG